MSISFANQIIYFECVLALKIYRFRPTLLSTNDIDSGRRSIYVCIYDTEMKTAQDEEESKRLEMASV